MPILTTAQKNGYDIHVSTSSDNLHGGEMLTSTDLNTVLDGGRYGVIGVGNTNTPISGEAYLEVLTDGTRVMQMLYYPTGEHYSRVLDGTWSVWFKHNKASNISYDNTTSGLTSADVKSAIDELKTLVSASGEENVQADWNEANALSDAFILNKPDLSLKLDKNTAITAGTATKITYDTDGLVTGGGSLILSDIPDLSTVYEPADATILKSSAIGVTVQAYDIDTAKTDVVQTFTASQRGTVTTDNDGSFDMNVTNKFSCTPIGNITLTFTNLVSGQGGVIFLNNSGGHTITKSASVLCDADLLTTVTTAGKYVIGYECDGINVWITSSKAVS